MSTRIRHSCVVVILALTATACVFAIEPGGGKQQEPPEAVVILDEPADSGTAAEGAPVVAAGAPAAAQDPKPATEDKKKPTAKQLARKAEKKAREVTYARMELALAEMDAKNDLIEANFALEHARAESAEARRNLEHFLNVARPLELEDVQIDLDRSTESAREQELELRELESMYEADDFAGTTKELVISRGKNRLLLTKRQHELLAKRIADKREHELAEKESQLKLAFQKTEQGVAAAQAKLAKTEAQNELSLLRARHKLEDAQRPDDEDEDESASESKGS